MIGSVSSETVLPLLMGLSMKHKYSDLGDSMLVVWVVAIALSITALYAVLCRLFKNFKHGSSRTTQ